MSQKNANHPSPHAELGSFIAGLLMLVVGLFIFSQKVLIYSSFFTSGLYFRGFHLNSGLVVLPLIAGIIWIFVSPKSLGAKITAAIGVLIIIVSIIMSTSIRLAPMTLFDWIVILVLIFGGGALVLRVLLTRH